MTLRRQRLRIETDRHRIEGIVQLPDAGFRSRITDYLNAHEDRFIAVTDATLVGLGGGAPEQHPYLAVSARHIVLVVELESLGPVDNPRGPATATG